MQNLSDLPFECVLKRSHRRSVGIKILPDYIEVRAPLHLSKSRICALVWERRGWIAKKRAHLAACPVFIPKKFVQGEIFTLLGQDYKLSIMQGARADIYKEDTQGGDKILRLILPPAAQPRTKKNMETKRVRKIGQLIEAWYRCEAMTVLTHRTAHFAAMMGLSLPRIKVRLYRARWGSCSRSGDISYNWQLIMAPPDIVDYVVVHELCHILEHNHSPHFWAHVARIMSDYKARKKWLRDKAYKLRLV